MSLPYLARGGNIPAPTLYPSAAAIPTKYRGCRFRSRLEARWAVFFDELGIGWLYEPEGYIIGGRRYLPDFLLECGTWVEVKGAQEHLDKSLMCQAALALPTMPKTVECGPKLLVLGPHPVPYEPVVEMHGDWGWLGIDPDGRGSEVLLGDYGFGDFDKNRRPWWFAERTGEGNWLHPSFNEWETDTSGAYAAATGARFEHGESGAR
ncbi:MAG: hypothetical protein JWO67_4568 [Streptosporangiaceae bacterium]|nr:hypothetical protein [Streptosporangiaceae bacterium]